MLALKRLRDAGVTVWIDQAGIDVATMWSQEIVSAIRGCKVMLLSISPRSTESENVVKELALASERKKPIIPVYLEQAEIPETMEYQLAGIQRVEYFVENEDAAFRAMIRSLAKRGVNWPTRTGRRGQGIYGLEKMDLIRFQYRVFEDKPNLISNIYQGLAHRNPLKFATNAKPLYNLTHHGLKPPLACTSAVDHLTLCCCEPWRSWPSPRCC